MLNCDRGYNDTSHNRYYDGLDFFGEQIANPPEIANKLLTPRCIFCVGLIFSPYSYHNVKPNPLLRHGLFFGELYTLYYVFSFEIVKK